LRKPFFAFQESDYFLTLVVSFFALFMSFGATVFVVALVAAVPDFLCITFVVSAFVFVVVVCFVCPKVKTDRETIARTNNTFFMFV
jgi:hypothetical protein